MSGEEKKDMSSNSAQPVHVTTENVGDSAGIARGMAERAAGHEGVVSDSAKPDTAAPASYASVLKTGGNNSNKKPVNSERNDKTARERDGADKGGYGGVLVLSGLVLVIGGIVGAIVQFTKKKNKA